MDWWSHISELGGLAATLAIAAASAAWLAGARCRGLALAWCALFGAALVVAVASQVAFIGWGIGVQRLDFTGFSGHATRAAAVYPVAAFLLLERRRPLRRALGVAAGVLLAALVALARIKVGAHSPSEAVAGSMLGLATAAAFMARALSNRRASGKPLLVGGLLIGVLLLPRAEPARTHQWVTAAALKLSGHDRPWLRWGWKPAPDPCVPPGAVEKVVFGTPPHLAEKQATDGMMGAF